MFRTTLWRRAVDAALSDTRLDVGVSPLSGVSTRSFDRYLSVLDQKTGGRDRRSPARPANLVVEKVEATSVTLAWSPSRDNVGVTGYGLYQNGRFLGEVSTTTATFLSLQCEQRYLFEVDAVDAAGNRSAKRGLQASAGPCISSFYTVTPQPDETVSGVVRWEAGFDGVALTRVEFWIDGVLRWTENNAPYVYMEHSGWWDTVEEAEGEHTLSLVGYLPDESSVRSTVRVVVRNAPAGDVTAPSAPSGLTVGQATTSSLAVTWSPSTDDVGVVGYGLYLNGTEVDSSISPGYTFAGLQCGSTYIVAVNAFDAASNRSAKATTSGATAPCPPTAGATVYVSTTGSDANPCTAPSPCESFDRAYRAARPGDVVQVGPGRYPSQTINSDPSKTSEADVVFRPAPGASVTIDDDLDFKHGSHITIEDMRIVDRPYVYPSAYDITLRRIVAAKFFIRCGHAIKIERSEFTDRDATGVPTISAAGSVSIPAAGAALCPSTSTPSSDVMLDNNYFHEIWRPEGDTSSHRECLHVMGVNGLVIKNSRFYECLGNTAAISFNIHDGSYIADAVVENNLFWRTYTSTSGSGTSRVGTGSGTHIHLSDDPESGCEITIRFNTMTLGGQGVTTFCPERRDGIVIESNIMDKAVPCSSTGSPPNQSQTYTWRHNVAQDGGWGSACNLDGTNVTGAVTYVDRTGGDLRLTNGAYAVDRGNPDSPPATDRFGNQRPLGPAPDAGAHEHS